MAMFSDSQASPRTFAVGLSATVTVLYAVVGFELVKVKGVAEVEPGPAVPLVIAAVLFLALTVLLAARPRTSVFVAGAVLDTVVIIGYFVVAPSRHPSFEPWGLTIKAVEIVLLVVLGGLLLTQRRRRPEPATASQPPREPALR